MQLNPYLHFDGRCEEAFRFYEQSLGGKIQGIMHHDGSPAANCAPADWKGKVMHACLSLGDQIWAATRRLIATRSRRGSRLPCKLRIRLMLSEFSPNLRRTAP